MRFNIDNTAFKPIVVKQKAFTCKIKVKALKDVLCFKKELSVFMDNKNTRSFM